MNNKYKFLQENPKHCKRLFGVKYDVFELLLKKVQNEMDDFLQQHPLSNRGLTADFSLENHVLLTLEYLRQYPTFLSLAVSYGISESYANKVYHKIRPVLGQAIGLKNPEKLKFKHVQKALIDV